MTAELPRKIAAGVTLDIPITLTAYPAGEWTLTAVLRGAGEIDLTATADGATHVLHATAGDTAGYAAGSYWYALRVTDGVETHQVGEGNVEITPDLAGQEAGFDGRDHVEKVLDAIEAVIEGRASKDQESYRINNRELQRTPLDQLIRFRQTYRAEARRQRAAGRRGQTLLGRRILTRF